MDNNLIPFPARNTVAEKSNKQSNEAELRELRDAFDDARKHWPAEMSELPEANRVPPRKVARS